MRITLLSHNLRVAGGLSVGKNITSLLPKLAPEFKYQVFIPEGAGYQKLDKTYDIEYHEVPLGMLKRTVYESKELYSKVSQFKPDVIWALGNYGFVNPPCSQIILFHKPQLIYPSKHWAAEKKIAKFKNALLKRKLQKCLKNTQLVFCQTPVAQKRFAKEFDYSEDQIALLPNAVSEQVRSSSQAKKLNECWGNTEWYNLFFLTKYYAHKNIESLIKIFKDKPKELKDVRCLLTVDETQHLNAKNFFKAREHLGLEDHIKIVGALGQDELAEYFTYADALYFPTFLESFSGTYLEAMYFGLPILTSDVDFARYICGDAALYFDPWDKDSIIERIVELKNNHHLKNKLIDLGKERMNMFFKPWEDILKDALVNIKCLIN